LVLKAIRVLPVPKVLREQQALKERRVSVVPR
jgi:hypothetical protein